MAASAQKRDTVQLAIRPIGFLAPIEFSSSLLDYLAGRNFFKSPS
jgi:hypothetical protein